MTKVVKAKNRRWNMMLELIQTRVDEFDSTCESCEIAHRGCTNAEKRDTNTIIMTSNANSFSYKMRKRSIKWSNIEKNNKIDIAMASKTSWKWTIRTKDATSCKMKVLGRETRCSYAESKSHKTTNSEWLQGGLMNVVTRRMPSLIQH